MRGLVRIGMAAAMMLGALVAGCHMGNATTITDHVTLSKGQGIELYQLVNVDPQGQAEFVVYSTVKGGNPKIAHSFVMPGQKFGGKLEAKDKVVNYDYSLESSDPAKQQVTVVTKITTVPK